MKIIPIVFFPFEPPGLQSKLVKCSVNELCHYKLLCFIVSHFLPKYRCPFTSPILCSALFPQAHCPLLSSPRWPPAGAAEPGEDRSAGAGEGALAPGGPVGEGAVGKGEPAHCGPGSAACCSTRGMSERSNSYTQHTRRESWGIGGRAESCRERDFVHQPGTVTHCCFFFACGETFCLWHWCLICVNKEGIIIPFLLLPRLAVFA